MISGIITLLVSVVVVAIVSSLVVFCNSYISKARKNMSYQKIFSRNKYW